MASLQANHLAKRYGHRSVIHDISLHIESGEVVGLLGPNGSGKTTCFYMIVGILRADGGQIILNGTDITRKPIHERARLGLGYLPQEASVFRKLSVEDNLLAILETRQDITRQDRKARADKLLKDFRIDHLRTSLGVSLSGGERRRVEIARALTTDPAFILLDEPFAGVDPISVNEIKDMIRHLQNIGIGVLVTDHNVRDTLDICGRAYIVGEGLIIAEGAPEAIIENRKVREIYLGQEFRL